MTFLRCCISTQVSRPDHCSLNMGAYYIECHPANRLVLWNLSLLDQLQLQCLIIEGNCNNNTWFHPGANHKMVFDHFGNEYDASKGESEQKTGLNAPPKLFPRSPSSPRNRDASRTCCLEHPDSKPMAGQIRYDARWAGRRTGKSSPTMRALPLVNHPHTLRGDRLQMVRLAAARSQTASQSLQSRCGLPLRLSTELSPDAPVRDTVIVSAVSAVGWTAWIWSRFIKRPWGPGLRTFIHSSIAFPPIEPPSISFTSVIHLEASSQCPQTQTPSRLQSIPLTPTSLLLSSMQLVPMCPSEHDSS